MNEDLSTGLILNCMCSSPEHIMSFKLYDWDTDFPEFIVEIQANHFLPWYKRIWPSIKYMFGIPGLHWHDAMIDSKDILKLKNLIEKYEQCQKRAINNG